MMTSASRVTSMMRRGGRSSRAASRGLVGRRAHVDEEERRDVALLAHARAVEPLRRRPPRAQLDARLDDGVQVEVLAVLEAAQRAVHLGADALELAAHLGHAGRRSRRARARRTRRRRRRGRPRRGGTSGCGSRRAGGPTRRTRSTAPLPLARRAGRRRARRPPPRARRASPGARPARRRAACRGGPRR